MCIASLASKRMLAKMLSDKFILLLFSRAAAPIWANENFTPLTAYRYLLLALPIQESAA
jgi:hypothetical protein